MCLSANAGDASANAGNLYGKKILEIIEAKCV